MDHSQDEIFNVEFKYKAFKYNVEIRTGLPVGPESLSANYDVYVDGTLAYTLNPGTNENDIPAWKVLKKPVDDNNPEFALAIANAIERYYL